MNMRGLFKFLAPKWLYSGEGELTLYSLSAIADLWLERARLGLMARFPAYSPYDGLSALGRDRKITRGLNEPSESYIIRLKAWLTTHKNNGSPFALMDQIRSFLQRDLVVRIVDQRGNWYWIEADGSLHYQLQAGLWDWDSVSTTNWSRFWIIIYPASVTPALWEATGVYGTVQKYGDGHVWGLTATHDEMVGLRTIVREWKPIFAKCEWIICAFDNASFAPGTTLDGLWVNYSKGSSPRSAARLATARYIRP